MILGAVITYFRRSNNQIEARNEPFILIPTSSIKVDYCVNLILIAGVELGSRYMMIFDCFR